VRSNLYENLPLDVAVAALETIDGPLTTNPHRAGKPLEEPFDGCHPRQNDGLRLLNQPELSSSAAGNAGVMSVWLKSFPLNSSASPVDFDKAYAKQSPKFRPAL
jgi:hypothetical protein